MSRGDDSGPNQASSLKEVWAREALEDAYTEGDGWVKERLFKPDMCIVEWRKLASSCSGYR